MKLPNELELIIVNFASGSQESYIPTSKVDEYEDCYEFMVDKKMIVLLRNQIRDITFVSK